MAARADLEIDYTNGKAANWAFVSVGHVVKQ